MSRLKMTIENWFSRNEEESTPSSDRSTREIKGSIFTLFTLFELVALTSYVPIDSYALANQQWDQINNLGGIVGAFFAEYLLGYFGVMGYSVLVLTSYLVYLSFKGTPIGKNLLTIVGGTILATLGAMGCFVAFHDTVPALSPLLGGVIGKTAGAWLFRYFSAAGSTLILVGGFVVTLIVTTDLSIKRLLSPLFGPPADPFEDFDSEEDEEELEPVLKKKVSAKTKKKTPKTKAKSKKKAKKKKSIQEEDLELTEELDLADLEDDEETEVLEANEGEGGEGAFQEIIPFTGTYKLPSLRSLQNYGGVKKPTRSDIRAATKKICEHLVSFNVTGEVETVSIGPILNTYEFKPSAGVKLKAIANVQEDLGIVMGTPDLRIVAPIPGKTVVGIEVPREKPEIISLKQILAADEFWNKKVKLPVAIGKGTDGEPIIGDLAAMPHLLVAGATGSGKSVFVNSLIMSFLYRMTPQQLRLVLIDPKMLELNIFEGLPHLVSNVITSPKAAVNSLEWAVIEMENRYSMMAQHNAKNIDSYNSKMKGNKKLPYIVIVVDELADLMVSSGGDVEQPITRLAQKARAAGIHMVIATQRPSTNVVTGLIKANIPSRLAFKVPSSVDSRTVLDTSGAQDLIGRGDSLMIRPGKPLTRIHGCFTSEDDLAKVTKGLVKKSYQKLYIDFSKAIKK